LEPTKKRRTKEAYVSIRAVGPAKNLEKAMEALESLGFRDVEESTPWREVFSEYSDDELPGAVLSGLRYREGLTQKQLSDLTGIPQSNISQMERGKRTIGRERAKRLAQALNADYRTLL
jgi:DNA-binding XRE family transcriptional regulator